jgi:hypothetical protein
VNSRSTHLPKYEILECGNQEITSSIFPLTKSFITFILIDHQIRLRRILDPKLYGTDVPAFNPPLCGELKATRFAGGRLLILSDNLNKDLYDA